MWTSKDVGKPINMRSLIDASAFLTVLDCTSFKRGVFYCLSLFSGFVCFDTLLPR